MEGTINDKLVSNRSENINKGYQIRQRNQTKENQFLVTIYILEKILYCRVVKRREQLLSPALKQKIDAWQ